MTVSLSSIHEHYIVFTSAPTNSVLNTTLRLASTPLYQRGHPEPAAQVAQFETDQPATVDVPIKFRLQK